MLADEDALQNIRPKRILGMLMLGPVIFNTYSDLMLLSFPMVQTVNYLIRKKYPGVFASTVML